MRPEDDHQLTGADDLRHRLLLVAFNVRHGRRDHEQVLVELFEFRAPVSVNGIGDHELVDLEDLPQGGSSVAIPARICCRRSGCPEMSEN